jgi:hypothetical protein
MALTADQQAQVDFQVAIESARHANQMASEAYRVKLESVRLAKETLIENARSKPVDSREITAADITAFAAALEAHINNNG